MRTIHRATGSGLNACVSLIRVHLYTSLITLGFPLPSEPTADGPLPLPPSPTPRLPRLAGSPRSRGKIARPLPGNCHRHPRVAWLRRSARVFDADGAFHLAPVGGRQELRELWRHALLRRRREAGVLTDWHIARRQTWRNRGFAFDAGEAPIATDDAAGRRRLAEYLLRAPFSLENITYNAAPAASSTAPTPARQTTRPRKIARNGTGSRFYPARDRCPGAEDRPPAARARRLFPSKLRESNLLVIPPVLRSDSEVWS